MHLCMSEGRRGLAQNMSKTTSPAVRPYHLFIGTPLPVLGNSLPFHRELSIIPHRIRDKDERPSEGESSRGGIALLLCSWWKLWSLAFCDSFLMTVLHDSSGEARLCMDVLIYISFMYDFLNQRSTPPSAASREETSVCQQGRFMLR